MNNQLQVDEENSHWFQGWLEKQAPVLSETVGASEKFRLQIAYTQIDRDSANRPIFRHHYVGDRTQYFYPASTVKLPVAVMALERINELNITGLNRNTTMLTEAWPPWDDGVQKPAATAIGQPSVAQYIKKILLVSDNDAYNRLYEWLGPDYINQRLQSWGFHSARILHRLEKPLTAEQNRYTPAVHFTSQTGDTVYTQRAAMAIRSWVGEPVPIGIGYYAQGKLVNGPMNFGEKNAFPLPDLHRLVQWIMFPMSQPGGCLLNLTREDYDFLRTHMGMLPHESRSPVYDASRYWPAYVKFLLAGSNPSFQFPEDLRIFNKVGDAYGFLIDGAYIVDRKRGVEFLLSAIIYCNSDGILNDDRYDYQSVGYPFLAALGHLIYQYECTREKNFPPDLRVFDAYFPKVGSAH